MKLRPPLSPSGKTGHAFCDRHLEARFAPLSCARVAEGHYAPECAWLRCPVCALECECRSCQRKLSAHVAIELEAAAIKFYLAAVDSKLH